MSDRAYALRLAVAFVWELIVWAMMIVAALAAGSYGSRAMFGADRPPDQMCQEEVDAIKQAWEARITLADFKAGYDSSVGWRATAPAASREFFATGPGNYKEAHKIMIGCLADRSATAGITAVAISQMNDDELMDAVGAVLGQYGREISRRHTVWQREHKPVAQNRAQRRSLIVLPETD